MAISRVSGASPTATTFAEGRGYGVSERMSWADSCSEIAWSWRCVGRGGPFGPLLASRLALADEVAASRGPQERAPSRRSENSPIALLPCQLTAGGSQMRGEPVSHCHQVPPTEATQRECWQLVGRGGPLIRQTADDKYSGGPAIPLSATLTWGCNIPTPQVGAP